LEKTKILIIGGGPAGATTSLFLAKYGIPHMLVDAATFPRDKVCGDGLDLKVVRVLSNLDPALMTEALPADPDFLAVNALRFTSPARKTTLLDYTNTGEKPTYPIFWTSKRQHFDQFLLSKADKNLADVRQGCKVTLVERINGGWQVQMLDNGVQCMVEAEFIVAADGDHSVMLRTLGMRDIDKTHYAGTLRQYWSGVSKIDTGNVMDVYTPAAYPMSYFWMFPLPNNEYNVGYGMASSLISKHKYNLRNIFADLIKTDPVLAERFADAKPLEKPIGWGLPMASLKRKTFGEGYVLIGDSASMVCPTNGEGIGTAMFSGLITARFIDEGIRKGDLSEHHFRNFDREIYRRLQQEIKTYRFLMQTKPWWLYNFFLNSIATHPMARRKYSEYMVSWMQTAYETPIEVTVE
jgi:menaquinone-9 beta-reductase